MAFSSPNPQPAVSPYASLVLSFFLFTFISSPAQEKSPSQLNQASKIHLQLDKYVYASGETIWFSAYELNSQQLQTGPTLQVELVLMDSVLVSVQYPLILSLTNGQINIPKNMESGWYQIRAFSSLPTSIPYLSHIYILGKKEQYKPAAPAPVDSLQISFFPEGGNLIIGKESVVAFKIANRFNRPQQLEGAIRDQEGNIISNCTPWHDGLGQFSITPKEKENYYGEWVIDGKTVRYPLPIARSTGTTLSVINHPEGFFFELNRQGEPVAQKKGWLVGTMNGDIVFKQSLAVTTDNIEGVLKTNQLQSGILNISVWNETQEKIAERNVFVNNQSNQNSLKVRTDTVSFLPRALNKWTLQLPDSLAGSLSISITDAKLDGGEYNTSSSIIAQTLLPYELQNQLDNPDWYFTATKDSAEIGLDLLMLTYKQRPTVTTTGMKQIKSDTVTHKSFITLSGKAFLRGTHHPVANSRLLVILTANQLRNQLLLTNTDEAGRFSIDSLVFFGAARLFFSEQRNKKFHRLIDVELDQTELEKLEINPEWTPHAPPTPVIKNASTNWLKTLEAINNQYEGITLEEVTVKARAKSPLEKLQEEYTSGAFQTEAFAERIIDLVNTDEALSQPNVLDYLRWRVPGLQVVDPNYSSRPPDPSQSSDMQNDPTKYRIFYRQMTSISSMGNPPMIVYLNEIETDADMLLTIPTSDIALIKIFSHFTAATGGGAGGVIAIYTKKPELLRENSGSAVTFKGYSPLHNFVNLNYSNITNTDNKVDNRITLYWQPTLFINKAQPQIPIRFYNNDRTRRFRIIVQGLTVEGNPIYFEKIIE